MPQEATRLQKLGRQKEPAWLTLKVPPKLPKLAECNAPVGAVRSHVQCHIVDHSTDVDAAQIAVQQYEQAEAKRQDKLNRLQNSREALKLRIHRHVQHHAGTTQVADLKLQERQAKRDRLQKFNQHVQDLRSSSTAKAGKPDEQQQPADLASAGLAIPSSQTDRAPLVTRHVPNKQVPADQLAISLPTQVAAQTSQIWGVESCVSSSGRAPSAAPQETVKARVVDAKQTAMERKIKEKRLILPALCGCPHGLSPISLQYPNACAINCPLYQNAALHGKLLQNLLQSYDL